MMQSIYIGDNFSIPLLDLIAFAWFATAWAGYAIMARREETKRDNLNALMLDYRLAWMRQMMKRDSRITDMTAIANLVRSISFFASTSIILQIGFFTMLGYRDQAATIIQSIPFAMHSTPFMWEFKIFLLMVIFIYAFFKFTWSLRQYNYATIYVSAAPGPHEGIEHHEEYAKRGARLLTNAAMHFNLGMRAYYYGLAVFAWFLHAGLFILVTAYIIWELYRREFFSHTYTILSGKEVVQS